MRRLINPHRTKRHFKGGRRSLFFRRIGRISKNDQRLDWMTAAYANKSIPFHLACFSGAGLTGVNNSNFSSWRLARCNVVNTFAYFKRRNWYYWSRIESWNNWYSFGNLVSVLNTENGNNIDGSQYQSPGIRNT